MASPVQRLNYHTGLFLEEQEFTLEQYYHLIMRQRINYAIFKPGVLYGMALDYTGGVLKVTAGLAIDETTDPDYGLLGRELVLVQDSGPVDLTGFASGNTVWITVEYDFSLDQPKPPTSTPSRYTQKVKITPRNTNPGTGTSQILLGSIVIGTDSHTEAAQKAVLRLAGPLPPAPTVTSFAPATGPVGTNVTITGTNFTGATGVSFGGTAATVFTVVSATQITATVPAGAVTGKIRVTTPAGPADSPTNFTVAAAATPTISSFTPVSGPVGTSVTITGTNFTGTTGVSFGGTAAPGFTVVSATQITATVPAGAVTGLIRVTTPAGFADSAANFTVGVPVLPPTFNAANPFAPRQAFPNNAVSINGTNFNMDAPTAPQVFLGAPPGTVMTATVTTFTATNIQITVPAAPPGTYPIRVRTSGGEVSSANLSPPVLFTVLAVTPTPHPIITPTPLPGPINPL